jgi:hypothetical protein
MEWQLHGYQQQQHKGTEKGTKTWLTSAGNRHTLLCPLIINATGNIATGATIPMLCKQNKLQSNDVLLEQPVISQRLWHTKAMLLTTNHWDK